MERLQRNWRMTAVENTQLSENSGLFAAPHHDNPQRSCIWIEQGCRPPYLIKTLQLIIRN
jgi:hypothetical protein